MKRRACRVDDNHGAVRNALRKAGAFVADTSGAGSGFPDLVVACRILHGQNLRAMRSDIFG